jgi:Lrp/AsnC family transcriptional regulator, leucine-responsive regulatory protein
VDIKDKKILYVLDKNSRASFSQIAKATRISQETVRYRVNALKQSGVIQKFLTILNTTKLGNSYYQIMLKLQNVNEQRRKQILNFLEKNENVAWIGNLEGNYDIAFILYVNNQVMLQRIIKDLYEQFSKFIMKKSISINLSGEFFPRDYLVNKERVQIKKTGYVPFEKPIVLDKIDKYICKLLSENARISSIEIANKLNISSDSVLQRLKKLKKENIILGHNLILNQEKIGQSHYKILIYLTNISKEKEEKLISFVRMNNRVIAIVKTLADWDYEIDLEVENVNQLKKFTMDLTNQFSIIIRDYDLIRIIDMLKYTFYPNKILK